ncbi:MAG: PD40 domain-containing protein [Deltaproteobacteria bacterium]|nr:PD40 domain-containing protein [Deltaproteobacteria bacterium]
MRPPASALALLLLLAVSACTGRTGPVVDLETLPPEPIAFVFLEPEKARDLAERMQKTKQQPQDQTPGVARLDQLAKLFKSDADSLASELLGRPSLLDPRTGEVTPFDALPKGSRPLEWSGDRTRLLFAAPRFDVFQISQVNVASGEVRTFTQGKDDHPSASLAPDGSLAFAQLSGATGTKAGESRIYVFTPGGGEPRPVSAGPSDVSPVWSRDGSMLVYQTRAADGGHAIAALQPLDGTPRILARGRDPVFTPDGQWIVFSQKLAAGYRLWRMHPDGSGKLALGVAPTEVGDELRPAVSPDGRYVAYVADEAGRRTLRIRRFDGGGDRELLGSGDGMLPTW